MRPSLSRPAPVKAVLVMLATALLSAIAAPAAVAKPILGLPVAH